MTWCHACELVTQNSIYKRKRKEGWVFKSLEHIYPVRCILILWTYNICSMFNLLHFVISVRVKKAKNLYTSQSIEWKQLKTHWHFFLFSTYNFNVTIKVTVPYVDIVFLKKMFFTVCTICQTLFTRFFMTESISI